MAAPLETPAFKAPLFTHALSVGSDTAISPPCNAVFVGGAGTVEIDFLDGTAITFTALAGAILPLRCVQINPGTATGVVALW